MKVIISGSRAITNYAIIERAIAASGFTPTLIIEGGQRTLDYATGEIVGGADYFAFLWAMRNRVPHQKIAADWKLYRKAAGPLRNREMAQAGDVLIAIPVGESRGTRNMILAMRLVGKPVFVYEL